MSVTRGFTNGASIFLTGLPGRAHLRIPARLTRPAHVALGPELETMFVHLLIAPE